MNRIELSSGRLIGTETDIDEIVDVLASGVDYLVIDDVHQNKIIIARTHIVAVTTTTQGA